MKNNAHRRVGIVIPARNEERVIALSFTIKRPNQREQLKGIVKEVIAEIESSDEG